MVSTWPGSAAFFWQAGAHSAITTRQATKDALTQFKQRFPTTEAVLISTCNRMEFYWVHPEHDQPRSSDVIEFIAHYQGLEPEMIVDAFYSYEEIEAIRHLFRVVSSLDSMVLGESQILGQVKNAFEIAQSAGTVGKTLSDLFPRAFTVAKDIHTRTAITAGHVSVGSTTVELAKQIFSRFDDKTVRMVGAGEMGELTLTHLLTTHPCRLQVANRTDERAVELSRHLSEKHKIQTEIVPYHQWINRLFEVDILISCTGARKPILTADQFAPTPAARKYRPMLLIDIAVPRNIEPAVGEQECVFLYNIDDLQTVTESTLTRRREAIGQCQKIIEAAVLKCVEQEFNRELTPVIAALRHRFHAIGQDELERIMPKLMDCSDQDRELIGHMVHRIAQKILHEPLELLHDKASGAAADVYADALRTLFKLTLDDEPPKNDK